MLICPGGGFSILAWDLEGTGVAEWLNSIGFAAVVEKYRVPTREHGDTLNEQGKAPLKAVGPVMDAQRAMSLTRSHAAEWGIDPQRIGIMGFSAGGETAGLTALLRDQRLYTKLDTADDHSCAPNFALPVYPGGFYNKETGGLKPYLKVTKDTPPMFFVMAQDDHVNSLNCTVLYTALTRQRNRIVILHQGDRASLRKYSTDNNSETARRLTNIFERPAPSCLRCKDDPFFPQVTHLSPRSPPASCRGHPCRGPGTKPAGGTPRHARDKERRDRGPVCQTIGSGYSAEEGKFNYRWICPQGFRPKSDDMP